MTSSITTLYYYAKFCHTEYRVSSDVMLSGLTECHYAECYYTECHYAECSGALESTWADTLTGLHSAGRLQPCSQMLDQGGNDSL